MNTFKTAVVLATLLGVGYGVHVVLNKPQARELPSGDEFGLPTIEGLQNPHNNSTVAEGNPHAAFEDLQLPEVVTPDEDAPGHYQSPPLAPAADAGQTNLSTADTLHAESAAAAAGQLSLIPQAPAANGPNFESGAFPLNPEPVAPQDTVPQDTVPQDQIGQSNQNPAGDRQVPPPTDGPSPSLPNPPQHRLQELSAGVSQSAFEQMWQSAQSQLNNDRYVDALFTLSLWYSDPSLTSQQRDRLIPMLDELAGKVIYSAEHLLEPPHTIQPGETLAQIAANHAVTSEFLARVNGMDRNAVLQPGEQIKVVRGPFRGELSLERREITVFVGRYYAGRFNVGVGRDLPAGKMSLEVAEKSGARAYVDSQTGRQTPAGDPANPYGSYWIGLRSPGAPVNPNLGVHSTGERVQASDTRGCISVSDRDADDLQAIFSIGSQFTVIR